MQKEVVIRGDIIYLRHAPDRSLESILAKEVLSDAEWNRLRTLLYFGEGAWKAFGRSYEEVIQSVRESMRNIPAALPRVKKIVIIDSMDIEVIKYKMLKKGLRKGTALMFPKGTYVYFADEDKQIREIVL